MTAIEERDAPLADAPVAHARDLEIAYETRTGELHAVRGVQLSISRGEIVALVGESGSGKSSIAMALLGLLHDGPSNATVSGTVSVLDVDLGSASADVRRELRRTALGAVFQDPMTSLNPTMTVGRQLMEVADSADRATALLDAVGVPDARLRLRSYPHELSGGQRQRVMIAMAIAHNPALVIADEPTTALDVTVQAQILALIRRLRDEIGCAFLLVTHDLGVAAQIADRIVVCYAGRVVETGATAELLRHPAHPYTAGLLRSRITLHSLRRRPLPMLAGEPPDPRTPPPGCSFAPRCHARRDICEVGVPALAPLPGRPAQLSACVRTAELEAELALPRAAAVDADGAGDGAPAALPPAEGQIALRLAGIEKVFRVRGAGRRGGLLRALRGVELEIARGESVALVGESGCGKSTLLRIVAGLLKPDAGDVFADGDPQMVFQDAGASLTPWLTVGEHIRERLRAAGVGRADVDRQVVEALGRVGLAPDVAGRKPLHLSGGQRQRVALARAIVVPPALLLCDEPTSSLDLSLAATVLNLIGRLRQELDMAVLFVTHDLAAARFIADRIAVMYLGRIVELGPSEEIASDPAHPYTKALLSSVPDLDATAPPTRGELPGALELPSGCSYHPRCAEAIARCAIEDQRLRPVGAGAARSAACVHVGEDPQ